MTISFLRTGVSAAALSILGSTAYADLTAQDVWTDWRAYMIGSGFALEGTEAMSGDTLKIADTTLSMEMSEAGDTVNIDMGTLEFVENADGTITVNMPPVMPIAFSGTDEDGSTYDVRLEYTHTGLAMVVSGDPDNMTYTYSAAEIAMSLLSLSEDGTPLPADTMTAELSLSNITGTTQTAVGALRSYEQRMNATALSYTMDFQDPESEDSAAITGGAADLTMSSDVNLPLEMDPAQLSAAIAGGFDMNALITYANGRTRIQAEGEDGFNAQFTSAAGSTAVSLGAAGLGYDIANSGLTIDLQSNDLPLPVSLKAANSGLNLLIPMIAGETEQDFKLGMTLGGFTMSDMIWSIFDAAGQLPRDPATIALDLTGKTKVLLNMLDEADAARMEAGEAPAELNALTLNSLLISAVGAQLSGTGDFTFDNTDLTSFDGIPRPTGAVDLKLVGGNALLDTLVAMGFIPQDQAMGARMMMGLFAVVGDEPDTLNSRLEINEQGHILANGQRIQ